VPRRYRARLSAQALQSHRGWDPGALALARELARAMRADLFYATTSRLLVELNRSPGHPDAFAIRNLSSVEKADLLKTFYLPYRQRIEARIAEAVERGGRVIHVSCHSFTPRLQGVTRDADIGLLFDPRRALEVALCRTWARALRGLRVRRNYPYKGTDDGLTTYLRGRFPPACYAGIEIEVNQKFPRGDPRRWRAVRGQLVRVICGVPHRDHIAVGSATRSRAQ